MEKISDVRNETKILIGRKQVTKTLTDIKIRVVWGVFRISSVLFLEITHEFKIQEEGQ